MLILNLSIKKSGSSKVLHLVKVWIMAVKSSLLRTSEYVWVRGENVLADWNGRNNYLYLTHPIRYRVNSLTGLRGKHRIINRPSGDFSVLSMGVVGYFGGKVAVIPTVRDLYID